MVFAFSQNHGWGLGAGFSATACRCLSEGAGLVGKSGDPSRPARLNGVPQAMTKTDRLPVVKTLPQWGSYEEAGGSGSLEGSGAPILADHVGGGADSKSETELGERGPAQGSWVSQCPGKFCGGELHPGREGPSDGAQDVSRLEEPCVASAASHGPTVRLPGPPEDELTGGRARGLAGQAPAWDGMGWDGVAFACPCRLAQSSCFLVKKAWVLRASRGHASLSVLGLAGTKIVVQ